MDVMMSVVQIKALNGSTVNELGRIWKEMVMAYFEVLSLHLPRGNEEKPWKSIRMAVSGLRFELRTSKVWSRSPLSQCLVTNNNSIFCITNACVYSCSWRRLVLVVYFHSGGVQSIFWMGIDLPSLVFHTKQCDM